ncbi:AI-2E family transporter [Gorillibacterium massiliense]|uniref:AI-2E family transporter n=1 Tax=Gorillibacterium massiliense TaxID=1280390 RepID=UPI0004AFAEAE|nr:AI-2E family transporter [Gorillibacterium massiliense]
MEALKRFFSHPLAKRISFVVLAVLLLYFIRNLLNLLLLLFVVTYVMGRLQGFLVRIISRVIPISEKLVITILYVLLVAGLLSAIFNYVPMIINQVGDLINNITHYMASPYNNETIKKLDLLLEKVNYQSYLGSVLTYIKLLGSWLEIILMVIILSFFFLLQRQKVHDFTKSFRTSKISWLYGEFEYYGRKFVSSFGKVIEVQLLIAVFNTVFTMIGLILLGFPYLVALTVLVFLLSLIPVAGVVISFIPIGIIGYQLGGYSTVIWTIVMVLIIHSLETYFLNPRLYAQKTKLPMFYTFIVLIFSQHYMGIWGLIIGIPIFMFFLDLLDVNQATHPKKPEQSEQTELIEK